MILAIRLKDIMWINATKTVRDWRKAILLNSAKKMVDSSNVVSGNGRKVIHSLLRDCEIFVNLRLVAR